MRRRVALCLVVAALAGTFQTLAPWKSAVQPAGSSTGASTELAARWYQRARQGQLHRRSTVRGRSIPHTIQPLSVSSRAS